jgi:Rrf2 family protein
MVTRRSKYAIRALLALTRHRHARALSVDALVRSEGLPRKFLEAIMADLKTAGFVASTRGNLGGYRMIRSPARITIGQIIRAVDGPIAPTRCSSASAYAKCDDCPDEETCAIRPLMQEVREAISRSVDLKTLEALSRENESRTHARVEAGDFAI